MKNRTHSGWLYLPLALLAGYILGGLSPRHELTQAKTEIDLLKTQPTRQGGAALNVLTDVVRIPSPPPPAPTTSSAALEDTVSETVPADPIPETPTPTVPTRNLESQLDAARELWEVRSDAARSSFLSRTGLTSNHAIDFDVMMAAMNLRLQASFEKLADRLSAGENMTPELGIRALNELTSALTLTYDELDRKLPFGWRESAGDEFDLTDFVNPSVAEPLIPIESKLNGNSSRRRRNR